MPGFDVEDWRSGELGKCWHIFMVSVIFIGLSQVFLGCIFDVDLRLFLFCTGDAIPVNNLNVEFDPGKHKGWYRH